MKKIYVLLICLMCSLLISTTVIGENVSNNIISENELIENDIVEDNTIDEDSEEQEENVTEANEVENELANEIENGISVESLDDEPVVKEGIYRIALASNPLIGLDIEGNAKSNKANVYIWAYSGEEKSQFRLKYDGDGYYKIINVYSGKALDVQNGGKTKGTNVWQYTENDTDAQKWKIVEKDGYYNIVSKLNNLALDIDNASIQCKTNVQVYTNKNTESQRFVFLDTDVPKSEKVLPEGTYRIATALKDSSGVEVKSASKSNKANVQLYEYKGKVQQKFKFEYVDGYYIIRNLNSDKVIDVQNGGKSSSTNVWQYSYNGTDAQKWIIQKTSDGYYKIFSKLNGLALDVSNGSSSNNTNIQVYKANETNSQKFSIITKDTPVGEKVLPEGTYRIALAENDKYGLDISGASKDNKGNVQLYEYKNKIQQRFNVVYNEDGYYTIIALHSGNVLDVSNGANVNGTNVWQYTNNDTDSQKWVIKENDNGTYSIISKIDSMYLDLSNGIIKNGTNIQINEPNGTYAQEFEFIEEDTSSERPIEEGTYRIAYSANEDYGLDVDSASTSNKANVQLWKYTKVKQQKFEVTYEDDGYYKIKNVNSQKYLEVDPSNNNVYQNQENNSDEQKWIIRKKASNKYRLISKSNNYSMDLDNASVKNGTNIQVYKSNNTKAQEYNFIKVGSVVNIDSNKYPGVQEAIDKLSEAHPNWEFEILYTTLDFDTAVQAEYEYENKKANLVYTPTYKGDWIAPNPYKSGNWASASFNGIAYFMDPRNFLNGVDIFQFVDLSDYELSGATLKTIQYQVNDTFLDGYAKDVQNACKAQDINPYFVLARLFQEQGYDGAGTINMDGGNGKKYFNPFNINAKLGNDVQTALEKAKEEGWDTMQKGLEGGIEFLKSNYIDKKQHTLYLNKFDVNPASPKPFYSHQYMQNLSAAYSEARIFRGAYEDTDSVDNAIKFVIPVYENMPDTPYDKPTGKGDSSISTIPDKGPMTVEVYDITSSLKVREGPGTNYDQLPKSEWLKNGTELISIERTSNGWHRVLLPSGNEGYASGEYLRFVDDMTNCNEKVIVDTKSNIGANVRIGPGTKYEKIRAVVEGAKGVRILKNKYKADGETWDIVIFDDGTKGFVAASSLKLR